jgi:hypothetical protein
MLTLAGRNRMKRSFEALMTLLLSLQLSVSQAAAWTDSPGEWHSGRPTLAAPAAEQSFVEAPVFRLELPFRTQKDGGRWQTSNCGPAILGMVLDAFGLPGQATDDLRYLSHTYQGTVGLRTGTALQHIAAVAVDFGVETHGLYRAGDAFRSWSIDEIRSQLRLGRPVMPLVRLYLVPGYEDKGSRWGHYLLLTGIAADGFYFSDPLKTDPIEGTTGYISALQLEQAIQHSHIPGQALAFVPPNPSALAVWMP